MLVSHEHLPVCTKDGFIILILVINRILLFKMDYHILETFTLKSMSVDIERELKRMTTRLKQLKEQKEIIDLIILHREEDKKTRNTRDDHMIHPLNNI